MCCLNVTNNFLLLSRVKLSHKKSFCSIYQRFFEDTLLCQITQTWHLWHDLAKQRKSCRILCCDLAKQCMSLRSELVSPRIILRSACDLAKQRIFSILCSCDMAKQRMSLRSELVSPRIILRSACDLAKQRIFSILCSCDMAKQRIFSISVTVS